MKELLFSLCGGGRASPLALYRFDVVRCSAGGSSITGDVEHVDAGGMKWGELSGRRDARVRRPWPSPGECPTCLVYGILSTPAPPPSHFISQPLSNNIPNSTRLLPEFNLFIYIYFFHIKT